MIDKAFHFIDRHKVRIAIIAYSMAMMVSICGLLWTSRHWKRDLNDLQRSINAVVSFDVAVSPPTAAAIAQASVEASSGHPATAAGSLIDYVATEHPTQPNGSRINVLISL